MNVGFGTVARTVPFLGIFVSNFWYCVFAVWALIYCTRKAIFLVF
jgi:hypothetical protein